MTRFFALTVAFLSAAAIGVSASVPVGVYGLIDKVVLEPDAQNAQRAQIWGAFAVWDDADGAGFRAPRRGYLYYSCSEAQIETCRNEWSDLKSIAGTGQMVGFGSRSLLGGRVRPSSERASAPDGYPIQFGVVQMGSAPRGAIFDQLRALVRAR